MIVEWSVDVRVVCGSASNNNTAIFLSFSSSFNTPTVVRLRSRPVYNCFVVGLVLLVASITQ